MRPKFIKLNVIIIEKFEEDVYEHTVKYGRPTTATTPTECFNSALFSYSLAYYHNGQFTQIER